MAEAPSAVDVEATLAHSRDTLTKAMTDVCGCDTLACAKEPLAAFDLWTTEHIVMQGRRGFEQYTARVAKDEVINNLRDELLECNARIRAQPLVKTCQKRLATATKQFAGEVPKVFPIYKSLSFRDDHEELEPDAIAGIAIHPGRTWSFDASVGTPGLARAQELAVGDTWAVLEIDQGIAMTRRFGPLVAVLRVRTEKWIEDEDPITHPLAKQFFADMRKAVDRCLQPRK